MGHLVRMHTLPFLLYNFVNLLWQRVKMSYPQTVVIWKRANVPGKDHLIYRRAPFWQVKTKEMHNFPILLSSYHIVLSQSKNHKNMPISKLLNGTVWTFTEILKKIMDTLCFSQQFLKSWAQATIASDFFPFPISFRYVKTPVTRNYQVRNKATRFVRIEESICTLHLSFYFYFHGT